MEPKPQVQQMNTSTNKPFKFQPKPEFEARMNSLLKDDEDKKAYWEIIHTEPQNSIRCNTLKISPKDLLKRFEKKGWKISQPFEKEYPEVMIIETQLKPGELGRSKEHLLGYYYVQEISSMLPILVLNPTEQDSLVDLCASPGSKTTQAAAKMNNAGNILANDNNLGRMVILAANMEKCGVSNAVVTKRDGVQLCRKLKKIDFQTNKILVDAPCSGEGTIRSNPRTMLMWNEKMYPSFHNQQKILASSALELLQVDGEMVYSTCTHAPEENEEIVAHLIENYDNELEEIKLPIKTRPGIESWKGKKFPTEIKKCARVYPQDNDTEGFFICKIKKLSDKKPGDENLEEEQ